MEFTLVYQGDLPPNGSSSVKWELRRKFDGQMRKLWECAPLNDISEYIDPNYKPSDAYLGRKVRAIEFLSPVSEKISTHADLDILLLSAGQGQRLTLRGGDIDNRIKTLLDSLQAPHSEQEIPNCAEAPDDGRVFCLLDDDKLVRKLAVRIGQLLTVPDYSDTAHAVIDVRIRASRGLMANIGIAL